MTAKTYCGYVAIIGRPNVGKSTLLNHLLGQKVSITSRKPQTTRHQILGIKTIDDKQILYVDTPGIHDIKKQAINRFMNQAAWSAIHDVDCVIFLVDARFWTNNDEKILNKIKKTNVPIILVLNKIDKLVKRDDLLPLLDELKSKANFAEIIPISAKNAINLYNLEMTVTRYLPENPHYYSADQITDRDERFLAAEIIREKIMRLTGQEVPYATVVNIEEMHLQQQVLHIQAVIWVEKAGQKAIIIGAKGQQLKAIGEKARLDLEKLFVCKVFLRLWVKVKEGWSDNTKLLNRLGFE